MFKLVINPEYEIKHGKPKCNHDRTVIKLGDVVYEFCDECCVVWIHRG